MGNLYRMDDLETAVKAIIFMLCINNTYGSIIRITKTYRYVKF